MDVLRVLFFEWIFIFDAFGTRSCEGSEEKQRGVERFACGMLERTLCAQGSLSYGGFYDIESDYALLHHTHRVKENATKTS